MLIMTILQILPIIISCIALTVSILSFKYKKNSGKIDKAIELANIYRSLIKDISEFSKIIDTHKHIHELIFKINIDKENLFTYEELNKFYSETDIKDLNSFFNGKYLITKSKLYNMQQLLQSLMGDAQALLSNPSLEGTLARLEIPTHTVKAAVTCLAIAPVMIVYPFTLKYFIKGINVGAVKG